jgi:hypothetical protein
VDSQGKHKEIYETKEVIDIKKYFVYTYKKVGNGNEQSREEIIRLFKN